MHENGFWALGQATYHVISDGFKVLAIDRNQKKMSHFLKMANMTNIDILKQLYVSVYNLILKANKRINENGFMFPLQRAL